MPGTYITGMEKCEYGNAPDVDANTTCGNFSLDFDEMLDGTNSALHQQLYEYFQGPSAQPALDFFPEHPPFPSAGPASFIPTSSPPFQSLQQPGLLSEPLQACASFVQERAPANYGSTNSDSTRSRQLKAIGTAMGHNMPPAAIRGYLAPLQQQQIYSNDQLPATFNRVFQAPGQASLGYPSDPGFVPREYSGNETSSSPNSLKRAAGYEQLVSPQSRPKGRKAHKVVPGQDVKCKRPTEQAEHIIRERQRRDDMTSKFLMLESLLPPGPKRDRSTVVDDSIQYVKSLHQRVVALNQKRAEMKSHTGCVSGVQAQKTKTPVPADLRKGVLNGAFLKTSAASKDPNVNLPSSPESESNGVVKSCIDKIEVHLDLPHQVVIEMTCKPHAHVQSQIMKALEQMAFDVSRCSIIKLHNRLICTIVVKPRVMTQPPITGDDVTEALKRAVVPDL